MNQSKKNLSIRRIGLCWEATRAPRWTRIPQAGARVILRSGMPACGIDNNAINPGQRGKTSTKTNRISTLAANPESDIHAEPVHNRFVQNICHLVSLISKHSPFYTTPSTTLEETRKKIEFLKHVIEDQDGYKIFYVKGKPVERERDLQILFKLVWEGSPSSVDSEVNNGRGPVDFKVSRGAVDNTLVEFKLASNSQLERNIVNQLAIYEKANRTTQSYSVILFFSSHDQAKVRKLLQRLKVPQDAGFILIDARNDNKPSASKAGKRI
jgi:hypothetical protein